MTVGNSGRGFRWNPWIGIPLLGTIIRLMLVVGTHRPLKGAHDQLFYFIAAGNIAKGMGYTQISGVKTAYYPPGYPYFLGLLQTAANAIGLHNSLELVAGLTQSLLAAVMIWSVMKIAHGVMPDGEGMRAAVFAGCIVAFWPNLIAYSAVLLSEQLYITLVCLTAACTIEAYRSDDSTIRWRWMGIGAAALSFAVVTRPQILLWPIGLTILLVLARRPWRETLRVLGAMALAILVLLVPWTARNATVFHRFVPLSNNSGDNLCIGFNPDSHGSFAAYPACESVDFYRLGSAQEVTRNEVNTKYALRWAVHNVTALPALTAWKFRWAYEHDYDGLRALEDYEADPWIRPRIRSALHVVFNAYLIIVGALAACGLVLGFRRFGRNHQRTRLMFSMLVVMTIANAIVPALFFGEARFKVPATPFYAVLAAVALCSVRVKSEATL